MKFFQLAVALFFMLLITQPLAAVNSASLSAPAPETAVKAAPTKEALSKKEKKALRKQFKKDVKTAIKAYKETKDTDLLLLVIITILLPPLGMALYDGISNRFWISLLLTLLFYLPGLIYTLVVILGEK